MAQVTKRSEDDASAEADDREQDDIVVAKPAKKDKAPAPDASKEPDREERHAAAHGHGFFTIYKKGQGYWTRMGTAIAAALLGLLIASQLAQRIPSLFGLKPPTGPRIAYAVATGFFVLYALLAWWLTNKPANVDFLISTDSEMKKVNWTSRRELIGSTKVVIVFMFLIALFLFVADLVFWTFFWLIGVLKVKPPIFGH